MHQKTVSSALLVYDLSKDKPSTKDFLKTLGFEELKLLQDEPRLLEYVGEIMALEREKLIPILYERFGITVLQGGGGYFWADIPAEDLVRLKNLAGARLRHYGWFTSEEEDFREWAQEILLQEARINILTLCVDKLREAKKNSINKPQEHALPGLYL